MGRDKIMSQYSGADPWGGGGLGVTTLIGFIFATIDISTMNVITQKTSMLLIINKHKCNSLKTTTFNITEVRGSMLWALLTRVPIVSITISYP